MELVTAPTLTVTDTESGKSATTVITVLAVVNVSPNAQTLTLGDTFTFMTYGSHTGAFSSIQSLNSGYSYDVTYNATNAQLRVTGAGVAATPEPGTWGLLLSAGMAGAGVLSRRRRLARK